MFKQLMKIISTNDAATIAALFGTVVVAVYVLSDYVADGYSQ